MKRLILIILTNCITLFFIQLASGSNPDSTSFSVKPQIVLSGEYDNNINLTDRKDSLYMSDVVFHLIPEITLTKPYKRHKFSIGLDGDLRRGINVAPWGLNLTTSGLVDLRFNNGIKLSLFDGYGMSDFDVGLKERPWIRKIKSNIFKTRLSYTLASRLSVYGTYENLWFANHTERGLSKRFATVFGTGISYTISEKFKIEGNYKNTGDKNEDTARTYRRTIHDLDGRFSFPIASAFGSYLSYQFQKQQANDTTVRQYDESRYVAGITWKGARRFMVWIEGGYAERVVKDTLATDYYNPVGELGFRMNLSKSLSAMAAVGIDVFGQFTLLADLKYSYLTKHVLHISALRKTETYYLATSFRDTYTSSQYLLEFQTCVKEVLQLKLGAKYQTKDDFSGDENIPLGKYIYNKTAFFLEPQIKIFRNFYINLYGSYLIYDEKMEDNPRKYDVWMGKVSVEYKILNWLGAGAHYQYSTRMAQEQKYDFEDTRIGGFIRFTL